VNEVKAGAKEDAGVTRGDVSGTGVIAVNLVAAVVALLLVSVLFRYDTGVEREPEIMPAVIDTSELMETRVLPESLPEPVSTVPGQWLQARGGPCGDVGSGEDVVSPFEILWHVESENHREFFSSPALVDGVLYFGGNDGYMRAVDASDGSVLWSFGTSCGICGEPAVDSNMVFFGGQDGYVYALDRNTGILAWSAGLGYHVFADVGIMIDSLILSGNSRGKICALARDDGEPVWSASLDGIVLGPAVVGSLAVFTSESGVTAVLDGTGSVLWKLRGPGQSSPPSADGEAVYVAYSGGVVRKYDLLDGAVIWERDVVDTPGRCVLARPVISGGKVFVGTNDATMVCLDAVTGGIAWVQRFENWVQLPPAIGERFLYVACDDRELHVLDGYTGEKVDSLDMGGYAGTAPLLAGGTLYFGNASGDFMAVAGTPPVDSTAVAEDSTMIDKSEGERM